jgi:hypothetical protein
MRDEEFGEKAATKVGTVVKEDSRTAKRVAGIRGAGLCGEEGWWQVQSREVAGHREKICEGRSVVDYKPAACEPDC